MVYQNRTSTESQAKKSQEDEGLMHHYNTKLGHGTVKQYERNWAKNKAQYLWPARR